MKNGYIIIDRVTSQILSFGDDQDNPDEWDGEINDEGEVVGNTLVFSTKDEATQVVAALEEDFKDEPGGINFEIVEVEHEIVPARERVILVNRF